MLPYMFPLKLFKYHHTSKLLLLQTQMPAKFINATAAASTHGLQILVNFLKFNTNIIVISNLNQPDKSFNPHDNQVFF